MWFQGNLCPRVNFVASSAKLARLFRSFHGLPDFPWDQNNQLWLAMSCLGSVDRLWSTNNGGSWTLYRVAVGLHEDPDRHLRIVKESKRNVKVRKHRDTSRGSQIGHGVAVFHELKLCQSIPRKDIIWHLSGASTPLPTYSSYPQMNKRSIGITMK